VVPGDDLMDGPKKEPVVRRRPSFDLPLRGSPGGGSSPGGGLLSPSRSTRQVRTSFDIASHSRMSRENSSASLGENRPALQELRRQLESLSALGSADALGGDGGSIAAAAAAAAMDAAMDGTGGGGTLNGDEPRTSSTRVERLLKERQQSMVSISHLPHSAD
jgi:hypothetical protein